MELQQNALFKISTKQLIFFILFLWLFALPAYSDVTFTEGFETGGPGWTIDNGVWEIGTPTSGPGACYSGSQCVATVLAGNYPANDDSRLISPTVTLPGVSGAEEIHLRFWQWFNYYPYAVNGSYDYGTVQISTDDGQTWTNIGNRIQDYNFGWSLNSVDLTAYAGQQVRLAFLHVDDPAYEHTGWYIDDVRIERFVPDFGDGSFEAGWGDWYADRGVWQVGTPTAGPESCYSGTQCAGTVLDGNYPAYTDSRLISPTITLPSVSGAEEVHLRFWQWFHYYPYAVNGSYDYGTVQISTDDGQTWTGIGNRIQDYSYVGWSLNSIDLTAYAGQQVRLAFYHSDDPAYEHIGWYIDDVRIERFVPDFGDGSFEAGWGDWYADRGVWQVGTPTAGPESCYSGTQCAGTVLDGNYPAYTDSRLISPTITLPSVSGAEEVHLRFWQWFHYYPYAVNGSYDYGTVQISTDDGQTWTGIGNRIQDYSYVGWSLNSIDLTAYAGQQVRLAFYHSDDPAYEHIGWYIDDVRIERFVPDFGDGSFEAGWGDWYADRGVWQVGTPTAGPESCYSGTQCAGTVLDGNYPAYTDSRLISPTITLPSVSGAEEVHLRFWQWFHYYPYAVNGSYDYGTVQISTDDGQTWTGIGNRIQDYSYVGWSLNSIDLTAYAGQQVRLAFYHSDDPAYEHIGWYIDDVRIERFVPDFGDGSFEAGWGDWYADRGGWQVGTPTAGPESCYSGTQCAGTVLDGNYPAYTDSRLISPTITLPSVSGAEEVHLRFWQWFHYYPYAVNGSYDYGTVQISTDDGQTWTGIGNRIQDYSYVGWSLNSIDLTAYAGQQVRLAFYHSDDPAYEHIGWYIDDVRIERFVPDFGDGSFEAGWGDWYADRGVWQVGTPTAGPESCYSGTQCAGTVLDGNYPAYTDSRLISPTITLPSVSGAEEVHLRFWQWFHYYPYAVNGSYDYGTVQISTDDGQTWTGIGNRIQDYSYVGWSLNSIDLTAYAGQQVRLAFYHSDDPAYEHIGWYIDDVRIERFVPDFGDGSFEAGWGDWYADRGVWQVGTPTAGPESCYSGTQCVGTVLDGNYPAYTDSRLISPTIALPTVSGAKEVHLRFWQWFNYYPYGVNYSNDYGTVQISTDDGQTWTNVGSPILNASGGWTLNSIELTAYAGQSVRLAFYHSDDPAYQSSGWFIDDILVETTGATNHPPELALINDQSVNESDTLTIPLSATDPNLADTLFYTVSAPSFVVLTDNGDWTAELVATPNLTDAGSHSITVTVTDLGGLSDSQTFTLTVNDSPQAPSLQSITDQSMDEGIILAVPIVATDPDGNETLTLSVTAPAFVTLTDNGDGTRSLAMAPGFEDSGTYSVTVTATDDTGLSVNRSFSLTVNDVPPPVPVVTPLTIDFGEIAIGTTTYESILLSNTGGSSLSVTNVTSSGSPFMVYPPTSFEVAAGGERGLSIGFSPESEGSFNGTITLENNSGTAVTLAVSGQGVTPVLPGNIEVTDYLDFGAVGETQTLQKVLTISNTGDAPLTISSAITDATVFQVTTLPGELLPYTINPQESGNLLVIFTPPSASAGTSYNGSLSITSNDPDQPFTTMGLLGKSVTQTDPVQNNPVLDAHVQLGSVADSITAASCSNVSGEVTLSADATSSDSIAVQLIDQGGINVASTAFASLEGGGNASFSGIDACALADGVITVKVVYTSNGIDLPAVPGTPAVKNTSTLNPPVLNPLDAYSLSPVIDVCGTSRFDTTVRIEGGASVVSTRLDAATSNFCLPVTLRQNTENVLIASAIDELSPAPKPIATATPVKVLHVDPSQIVIAEAYSRPLTTEEITDLVDKGIIDPDEASNFNVSMFTVVLTIGSYPVTITQPVVHNPTTGSVSYGRTSSSLTGSSGSGWVGGSSGGTGTVSTGGGCRTDCAQVVIITTPSGQTIPGVIIIDGRIKTLKEFFQVTLLLHNVSTGFVLSDMSANIVTTDALTTIASGLGTDPLDVNTTGADETLVLGEILPGNTGAGQFIVRGDAIGIQPIDIYFDGNITGGGLPVPIPVSGVASTSVEVLGPPELSVVVRHPSVVDGPDVTLNEVYDLLAEITNSSDRPALFTSLELFVGGDALLVDEFGDPIAERSQTIDYGILQPGETVISGFRVQSLAEGEIIACQAITAENILLTVDTGPDGTACNIVNTYPANFVPLDPDHEPVVMAINPLHQQTNIPITTSVVATFTPQTQCIVADTWENVVTALIDPNDPSKGLQVVSADLVQAGTYYLEELNASGEPVRHIPTDLTVENPPAGGTTIAVLRLGLDDPHPNSQFFLKADTTYRATILGGEDGVCSASSGKTMGNDFQWIFYTGEGELNNAPVMEPIADQTVEEGSSLSVAFSATDPDLDALTFSVSGPSFINLLDNGDGTGHLAIEPGYTDTGVYNVIVSVTDAGGLTDSTNFTLTVLDANRQPSLDTLADQVMNEGAVLSLPLSANDPDVGDTLTLSVTAPPFATLIDNGGGSGSLTLSPDFTQAGVYTITATVTDQGGLSASQSFSLTVVDINRPPTLNSLADQAMDEGTSLSVPLISSDPDIGDVLTFSINAQPFVTLVDNGNGTGQLQMNPGFDDAGVYPISVTVTDLGGLSDEQTFTLTVVNSNRAPVLEAVGDQAVDEGVLLSFVILATDPDGDNISLTAQGLPVGAVLIDNGNGTAQFSWTPSATQAGSYTVEFRATDDGVSQASDSELITIVVGNINHPPILDQIGNQSVEENAELTILLTASDIDGDALTFTGANLPTGAGLTDNGDGTAQFNWTPSFSQAGNYLVRFIVTDNGEPVSSDSEEITITVGDVNQRPVLAPIGNQQVDEGDELSFLINATDPDDDNLSFSGGGMPEGAVLTDNADGTAQFSWTPDFGQADNYQVLFIVTDDGVPAASDNEEITITVGNVNRPPILDPIGNRQANEGDTLFFAIIATDPDNDNLSFAANGLPEGATLADQGNGTALFNWSPSYTQAGNHSVEFVVTDDGAPVASDSEEITITIGNVNRPPILDPIGDRSVAEGELLSFILTASDPDGDLLAYTFDSLPAGAELIDNGDGTALFKWLSSTGQAGEYPVSFTITDTGVPNLGDTEAILITVEAGSGCGGIIGDLDGDCDVDRDDLNIILAASNTPASGSDDPRDIDGDGMITANDARQLVLLCTRARCATE